MSDIEDPTKDPKFERFRGLVNRVIDDRVEDEKKKKKPEEKGFLDELLDDIGMGD